jgi:hypothetical protein
MVIGKDNLMKYIPINWSPFATNILDAVDYDLCTPNGTPVIFRRGSTFVAIVGERRFETDDNLQMSYFLNANEVGGVLKA